MKFRTSKTLLTLFIATAMLVAANAGLPSEPEYFWHKFILSILIAGTTTWRNFLSDPVEDKTKVVWNTNATTTSNDSSDAVIVYKAD